MHEARSAIYAARRATETSLMSKGIFKSAQADSDTDVTGEVPPVNMVFTMGVTMWDYSDLIDRIEAIGAEIDDMAFDQLREASADGQVDRPASDKRLMQARRALEKAAQTLRSIEA